MNKFCVDSRKQEIGDDIMFNLKQMVTKSGGYSAASSSIVKKLLSQLK